MYSSDTERNHFLKIIEKYASGTATPDEVEFVEKYYSYLQKQPDVLDNLPEQDKLELESEIRHRLLNDIEAGAITAAYTAPVRRLKWKLTAAAALLLIGGAAAYTYLTTNKSPEQTAVNAPSDNKTDIPPGGNKALLTLADGTTIELDNAANGTLAQQGNIHIIKLNGGALAYKGGEQLTGGTNEFNTIATPKGGQYQVVLPDGSRVWLNAASYIKFPVAFGGERKVEIGGEAYFEIAKDAHKPFQVKTNSTEIQVLGTSFNINAYPEDAAIQTTLLEGSVKVVNGSAAKVLKPGEQAQITIDNAVNVVKDANTMEIMAWKNGLFYFNKADVKTFMRQLERWYDIEVKYEGELPDLNFSGKMQRNLNLSQLLKVLDGMEVPYRMEGRTLTVRS